MRRFTPLVTGLILFTTPAFTQLNMELLGHLTYPVDCSNVWAWADGAGHEYAIVGTYDGTSIVDITDPTDPVEVQFVDGVNSIWRQIGVWDHYAYVANEGGGGILCIDLSGLPGPVTYNFTSAGIGLNTSHILYCDELGTVHVFGSNVYGGGDVMLDATADPLDPPFLGAVDEWYIHHGYARGDTLWASNIYEGWFSVWDISDKTSPVLLATQSTPGEFTHNVILSDDGNYLFTTDEVSNGSLASYNVSDLADIKFLDEFRATPGTSSIPHYAWYLNGFVTTAWYRDGAIITDAHYPDNMIKTGYYDTSPFSGDGFNGAWGIMPYLPSGVIVVSDIEEGLFILQPTYVQACYIEGNVTDATTTAPIFGVEVSFTGGVDATTSVTGDYHSGIYAEGTYDVTFTKAGYIPQSVTGVSLSHGVVTTVDAALEQLPTFAVSGTITDAASGDGIEGADVLIQNDIYSFTTTTDASGNFLFPSMYDDSYTLYAGHWGHITNAEEIDVNPGTTFGLSLERGYYDDFLFNKDWTTANTASSGLWERAVPEGTFSGPFPSNPGEDASDDFGDLAYVTGNNPAGGAGGDDVDNGTVDLYSPTCDLSTYLNPVLSYERWFFNGGGTGTPNDTFKIYVNNGLTQVLVDVTNGLADDMSEWVPTEIHIADYIDITSTMTFRFHTSDQPATGHLVEAGVDKFYIYDDANAAPSAAFVADNVEDCAPLTVHFTDNSIGASSWSWSFTGGTPATSTLQDPTVTYSVPGVYDVSLTATNAIGSDTHSESSYITVLLCNAIDNQELTDNVSVQPNPFKGQTTILFTNNNMADAAEITDLTGRVVLRFELSEGVNTLSFGAGQPSGVYMLNFLKEGTQTGSVRLVKAE
ncbi:MAG: choice-of-anchor B family protein [Chitinophagales bacterium]